MPKTHLVVVGGRLWMRRLRGPFFTFDGRFPAPPALSTQIAAIYRGPGMADDEIWRGFVRLAEERRIEVHGRAGRLTFEQILGRA